MNSVDKDMRGSGLDLFYATPIILLFLARDLSRRILQCETTILSKYMKDRGMFHLKRKLFLGLFNNPLSAESPSISGITIRLSVKFSVSRISFKYVFQLIYEVLQGVNDD